MSVSRKSASKIADADFTPRRSMRCNKLDISMKEQDLRRCSLPATRTPHRITKVCSLDVDKENISGESSSSHIHSSGEKSQNQKKRNKKSKKQKAKANQKRKEAKKIKAQSSNSDENEDVSKDFETAESGFEASSKELSLTDSKIDVKPDFEPVISDVVAENTTSADSKQSSPESGFDVAKSTDMAFFTILSPDMTVSKTNDVINLVTPDLVLKDESMPVEEPQPDEPVSNESDNKPQHSKEEEEGKDGTYDLSESQLPETEIKQEEQIPIEKEVVAEAVYTPKQNTSAKDTTGGPRYSSTPARKSILSRKATPFKPIPEGSLKKALNASVAASPTPIKTMAAAVLASPVVTPITTKGFTKTPLKSALRTRRSYSMDDADLNATSKKGVVFHSPSNTTINIEEVDMLMKSKKKLGKGTDGKEKGHVTVRRKRSMSVAETESEKEFVRNLQPTEDEPSSASKKSDSTTGSRVKLPNFAAIHKHQFERMESISDHVARKNERAKVLSGSKQKKHDCNSSISKSKENISNSKTKEHASLKKDVKRLIGAPKPVNGQPKARQRIELSNIKVNKTAIASSIKAVLQENKNKNNVPSKPVKAKITKDIKKTPEHNEKPNQINDRHKMHMSMYKNNSLVNGTVLHEDRKERKDYIAGVRSNRRFMLQMQHRDKVYK